MQASLLTYQLWKTHLKFNYHEYTSWVYSELTTRKCTCPSSPQGSSFLTEISELYADVWICRRWAHSAMVKCRSQDSGWDSYPIHLTNLESWPAGKAIVSSAYISQRLTEFASIYFGHLYIPWLTCFWAMNMIILDYTCNQSGKKCTGLKKPLVVAQFSQRSCLPPSSSPFQMWDTNFYDSLQQGLFSWCGHYVHIACLGWNNNRESLHVVSSYNMTSIIFYTPDSAVSLQQHCETGSTITCTPLMGCSGRKTWAICCRSQNEQARAHCNLFLSVKLHILSFI